MSNKYLIVRLAAIIFLFSIGELKAQDSLPPPNSILISPFGLIAGKYKKIRIRFQHATKSYFVFGTDFEILFPKCLSGIPNLAIRKNLSTTKLNRPFQNSHSFYLYATGVYGKNKNLPENPSTYYDCFGGGLGAGWQLAFGHNKDGVLDLAFGFKYVMTNAQLSINNVPEGYDDYFFIGPAALFDGIIGIGFRF